jgi:hypothetical protein
MIGKLLFFCRRVRLAISPGAGVVMVLSAHAQKSLPAAPEPDRSVRERVLSGRFPPKPSLPPAFSIPIEPLGFSAPGPLYLGQRNSVTSLDFLDEDRLLFTFRVPGLLRRQPGEEDERRIRAVILRISTGAVEAQTFWTLHDRARYLWMLADGHFLVRDNNALRIGDASLALKPFLTFPGSLLSVDLNPSQQLLVTNSREPLGVAAPSSRPNDEVPSTGTPGTHPASEAGSSTNSAGNGAGEEVSGQPDLVLRVLNRSSGEVKLVSRVRKLTRIAINSAGYFENLRGNDEEWLLSFDDFSGGSKILSRVRSRCAPAEAFISENEALVTSCASGDDVRLLAITSTGRTLWDDLVSSAEVWPLLVMAPNGLRLARETLEAPRAVTAMTPLDTSDIKGQAVLVFDAATGEVLLETPVSPVLDAGGNVAFSPSARRVAVLNAGAVQVFELPAPPPLPSSSALAPGP